MATLSNELQVKLQKLAAFLDRHSLDGVLLWERNNFAWITGGKDNHIANNSPVGVAGVFATRDKLTCLTNTIEAPRFRAEELEGTGIDLVEYPWWSPAEGMTAAARLFGSNRRVACDADPIGLRLPPLPREWAQTLRWSLLPEEIERYREGARRASAAVERACRAIKPGMTEHEAAGLLDYYVHGAGSNPVVTLIAADERITSFRHPIPTTHRIQKTVMLVSCAEYGGLISNLTRFIHFGPLTQEIKDRQQLICNVDAAVNLATRPGRTFGEIFGDLQLAYAAIGHADQWKLHHQGGSTGYAGREAFATPDDKTIVQPNQAFAWNPSIPGAKSEDTMLVTDAGIEVLTAASSDFPTLEGQSSFGTLRRPGILVL